MTRVDESRALVDWAQSMLASDGDLLSEVLRLGLEQLIEAEQTAYLNAERHERTEDRRTRRNGYRTRTLETRAGELELRVPRTRDGELYPFLLQRYQRSERALVAALAECYTEGVSTRRVSEICEELFDGRVSHETVSRYVRQLLEEIELSNRRSGPPLAELLVDEGPEDEQCDAGGEVAECSVQVPGPGDPSRRGA